MSDLVTRKCALESSALVKDRTIQELNDRVKHLESVVMQLERQAVAPSNQSLVNMNLSNAGKRTDTAIKTANTQEYGTRGSLDSRQK